MHTASPHPASHANTAAAPTPFLKWAGGKRRLLPQLLPLLPKGKRLIEPFVGAGSVFLSTEYDGYLLSDSNHVLIALYERLRAAPDATLERVRALFQEDFRRQERFLMLRERYNQADTPLEEKAALLVYLNKFGFNGLYRENRQGQFNTPYGHPAKCPACPETAMRTFARRLAAADLRCGDFSVALAEARPGDVVYADPPYAPPDGQASFTAYGPSGFPWSDQLRLANAARELAGRGIPVVISNHDTEETRALYAGARLHTLTAYRSVAANSGRRGIAAELVAVFQ